MEDLRRVPARTGQLASARDYTFLAEMTASNALLADHNVRDIQQLLSHQLPNGLLCYCFGHLVEHRIRQNPKTTFAHRGPFESAMNTGDRNNSTQPRSAKELLSDVYSELRNLARHWLVAERPGNTLQPTALVHEAYLRLIKPTGEQSWANQAHFFAAAAEAMRRILIESARGKSRLKRGGDRNRVELDDYEDRSGISPDAILDLDVAMDQLSKEDPDAAEIVRLHFYAGVSIEEAGDALGISRAEAYRQWAYARAWLRCAMDEPLNRPPPAEG